MPFPALNLDDPTDKQRHSDLVALGGRMLRLNTHLAAATLPPERTGLERRLESTAREIDKAVYALFGLGARDVNVIEGEAAKEAIGIAAPSDSPQSQRES
jgi:hypothetical protein